MNGGEDELMLSRANSAFALLQARKGGFKDTPADDLLCAVLVAVLKQTGVEPEVTTFVT